MENVNYQKKKKRPEKIIGAVVPAFLLLYLQEWEAAGISVRTLLIYLYTFFVGSFWIKEKKTGRWDVLHRLLGIFLVWNVLKFAADLIRGNGGGDCQLLLTALVLLFLFFAAGKKQAVSTDWVLVCAGFAFMGLFRHFFVDENYSFNLQALLRNEDNLASFLILVCVTATAEYCREEEKVQRRFYFAAAFTGYFLLFTSCNIMAVLLTGLFFPLFLLVQTIDRMLVKNVLQMAFLYFFLLANMPLLAGYMPAARAGSFYSLENGVCLELVLAVSAVAFFLWWDRYPADQDKEEKHLLRFRNGIKWILVWTSVSLLLLLATGRRLGEIEGPAGVRILGKLAMEMQKYCGSHNGMFPDMLEQYGIPGWIWLSGVITAGAKRMKLQVQERRISPLLQVLLILFLLQAVFISLSPVTAPVQVLLAAQALYGDGEEISLWK